MIGTPKVCSGTQSLKLHLLRHRLISCFCSLLIKDKDKAANNAGQHHTFISLSIQDIESFNKSISTSSLIQNLPSISPAISLPNPTEIILYCHLTPSCTSLISFEFDVNLNRINLGVDFG